MPQKRGALSEISTSRYLSQLPQTLLTSVCVLLGIYISKDKTSIQTLLTTWRTAQDLKRGIAGASGSGLTNPGKKGDHLSQDLKKDSYWCLRSSRVRGPRCDDLLMTLSPARGGYNEQPAEQPSPFRRPSHEAAGLFWASEADLSNCSVADRTPRPF